AVKARSAVPAASERAPQAPFVGRQEELSLVLNTLARSRRHRTVQLVTIVGVAGIGKSRLVWELQQTLEDTAEPVTWRRGRCLPYGEGVAYWALDGIVRREAGFPGSTDAAAAAGKFRASVRRPVPGAEPAW